MLGFNSFIGEYKVSPRMEYLLEALPLYKMILFHCIYKKSQKSE